MRTRLSALTAVLVGLAACQCPKCPSDTVGNTSTPAPADVGAGGLIQPGKYRVCDIGRTASHGDVVGSHVNPNETVEIMNLDPELATQVCLKEACPPAGESPPGYAGKVLWMTGNNRRLSAVQAFEHKNEAGAIVQALHLVEIVKDPADKGTCTKSNVLTLRFCFQAGGAKWTCTGTEPDYGHAHVEN